MPGRWARSALAAAESVLFRLVGLSGRPGSPWVGRRALFRAALPAWADDPPGDDRAWFRVFAVAADEGGRFQLASADGRAGPAAPDQLIFLDGADDGIAAPVDGLDHALIRALMARGGRSSIDSRFDRAAADFAEAACLDPGHVRARMCLGEAHFRLGDYDGAFADFDAVCALDPGNLNALNNRSAVRLVRGEYDLAIAECDAILRDRPNSGAFNNRGYARLRAGDADGARADFEAALRLNPRYADALVNRASLRLQAKEYHQARADADAAVRIDPASVSALVNRGIAHARLQDFGAALDDFEAAVELDPTNAVAIADRAWLRATCPDPAYRDGALALGDATRACELMPEPTAFLLRARAAAHAEVGDFAAAASWEARAVDREEDPEAKKRARARHAGYVAGRPHRDEEW